MLLRGHKVLPVQGRTVGEGTVGPPIASMAMKDTKSEKYGLML